MNPVVLRTVARMMTPVLLLLSLVLLVRGHNAPGGGFVGGLMTASALILYLIAYDVETVRRLVRVSPVALLALGLLVSLGSGLLPMARGRPFLTGLWTQVPAPWGHHIKLGTPLLFDLGVYLVVVGATLGFILAIEEGEEAEADEDRERGET
ncbi:Na+/H+ antiporter subunit B [Archangium violaceum]|uniref:Na+/H+ antiporter subunit B n=1 Tax=Archangium violaceum TaxID=83451 RepID=UPI002B31893F|nr:Na+/H+ antiporter subunit B [Archangium violaceum]